MGERRVLSFREFVLEEGEVWDALKFGVGAGVKAFKQKRKEQVKPETQTLTDKILTSEGENLKVLIKQIVDNGYSIRNGKVIKPSRHRSVSKEDK